MFLHGEVRVRRTNAASGASNIQDKVFWDSRIELIDIKVGYEDAAVVGLAVDSVNLQVERFLVEVI